MQICENCHTNLEDDITFCTKCGAKRERNYSGLVSGPFLILAGLSIHEDSKFWAIMICALGVYALTTVRNFRWKVPG